MSRLSEQSGMISSTIGSPGLYDLTANLEVSMDRRVHAGWLSNGPSNPRDPSSLLRSFKSSSIPDWVVTSPRKELVISSSRPLSSSITLPRTVAHLWPIPVSTPWWLRVLDCNHGTHGTHLHSTRFKFGIVYELTPHNGISRFQVMSYLPIISILQVEKSNLGGSDDTWSLCTFITWPDGPHVPLPRYAWASSTSIVALLPMQWLILIARPVRLWPLDAARSKVGSIAVWFKANEWFTSTPGWLNIDKIPQQVRDSLWCNRERGAYFVYLLVHKPGLSIFLI